MWRQGDVEEDTVCPVFLIQDYDEYFFAWTLFNKGVMPESGGWEEQAYHWIAAFRIIEPVVIAVQIEDMKRQREAQQN